MPALRLTSFFVFALAVGCEAIPRAKPGLLPDPEPLAEYSGSMKRLFDDEFGGQALGTQWNDSLAEQDALLSKRALSAASIVTCSIETVTEGSVGESIAALVELRTPGRALIEGGTNECPQLAVPAGSFSYSILRQSGASLVVGKSIVLFARQFYENGGTTWHWHIEPDRPEIRGTVQRMRGP